MERCRVDRSRTQRCGNYNNVLEPTYDVVDDEEVNVQNPPSRRSNDEGAYADRDLPRSAPSLSPACVHADIPHRQPRREAPHSTAPVINRDIKPGRRKKKLDKKAPPAPTDQHPQRSFLPPPAFTSELTSRLAGVALRDSCREDKETWTDKKEEFTPHAKDSHSFDGHAAPNVTQRHSLDLESHNIGKRSSNNFEEMPSQRHHHEWPQTKEDYDHHDFVPIEKPHQICSEEDWYVGECSRADAEHALHLVNKDGAFLVRDCSVNTNSDPLVLVVYHEKKVYNVKIRFLESSSKFALGTGHHSKDLFDSVLDIIKFHSIFPIILISGRNTPASKYPENCVLTCPVTKRDVDQLLQQ